MLKRLSALTFPIALACVFATAGEPTRQPGKGETVSASSLYDFTVKDIDGKDVPLAKYKGDVLLIVNVASK